MHNLDGAPAFEDYLLAQSILTDARAELGFSNLLITDGATGLGRALVELSGEVGVQTIVGVHGVLEESSLRALRATHVIRRDEGDLATDVMRLTASKGVEVIIDQRAGRDFSKNFDMIADFGNLLVTGWGDGDPSGLFETLWAALDRCPCMQLWTIARYSLKPERLSQLEREVRALIPDRSQHSLGIRS